MRKIHTTLLAVLGLALGIGSLSFALAADPPPPDLAYRAVMPAVAGDDSSFVPGNAGGILPTSTVSGTTPSPAAIPYGCAGFRSDIKTLSDDAAAFAREAQGTNVTVLLMTERPEDVTNASERISPFEGRVVEVTAHLLGYRRTSSGGIDLAVAHYEGGEPMLVSFPSQQCLVDTPDVDRGQINSARVELQQQCGNPPNSGLFKPLGGKATIRGVPFWGTKQSDGVSGSGTGLELGPALFFEFDNATSCDADASKTPYPTSTPTPVLTSVLVSVGPQAVARGELITVSAITVPAIEGRICSYDMWDANSAAVLPGTPLATAANGIASWTMTIPLDMALGQARVQARCTGMGSAGSAPFTILPALN